MRIAFIFILIFAFAIASGCLGEEKAKEKISSEKAYSDSKPPGVSIKLVESRYIGDFGKLKNVTILTKELIKGGKSHRFYQAIYYWKGEAYRTGALNLKPGKNKSVLPVSPPETNTDAYAAAFQWIRNNTPEDAVFLSWWDYGDLIRLFTQRETLISDPCSRPECLKTLSDDELDVFRYEDDQKFFDVVRFFNSNEDEAYKIAKKYGVDYVFVTYEDFAKMWAIDYLGGKKDVLRVFRLEATGDKVKDIQKIYSAFEQLQVSAYFIRGYSDVYEIWYLVPEDVPKVRERLLLSLLPLKIYPDNIYTRDMLSNFQLVYHDKEEYIYIFKVT